MTLRARARLRTGRALALVLVLVLALALGSPAVGGPKVLTVAKAKKLFLTKKAAAKTYLPASARAEFLTPAQADARYLTPGNAAATYLPLAGETRVPLDPAGWVITDSSDTLVTTTPASTLLTQSGTPATGVDVFAPVPAPTLVSGTVTSVVGFEACYEFVASAATEANLDRMALQRAAGSPGDPVSTTMTDLFVDGTGRLDNACTTVRFPPIALQPNDALGIALRLDFPSANTQVRLGRGSLILAR